MLKAWAIRRLPADEHWDRSLIKETQGTPQIPDPRKPGVHIPVSVSFEVFAGDEVNADAQPARRETTPRAVHIGQWMLEQYGCTDGCQGCDFKKAGVKTQRLHSQVCRARIEAAMDSGAQGRKAKAAARERFDHWAPTEMERMETEREFEEAVNEKEREEGGGLDVGRTYAGGIQCTRGHVGDQVQVEGQDAGGDKESYEDQQEDIERNGRQSEEKR